MSRCFSPPPWEGFDNVTEGCWVALATQRLLRGSARGIDAGEAFVDELLQLFAGRLVTGGVRLREAGVVLLDHWRVACPIRFRRRILRGYGRKMSARRNGT